MTNTAVPYDTLRMSEPPAELEPRVVYIVGEGKDRFCAAMVCPCGCGAELYMSLVVEDEPSWRATIHRDGTCSLFPSVARVVGCRSHFVFRRGQVVWCVPSGRRNRRRGLWDRVRSAFWR